MDGYGTYTWTCGECGDSFSASGVVGDLRADRWGRDHKERHRVEKLPLDERLEESRRRWAAETAAFKELDVLGERD